MLNPERMNVLRPVIADLVDRLEHARRFRRYLGIIQKLLEAFSCAIVLCDDRQDLAIELDRPRLVLELRLANPTQTELEGSELFVTFRTGLDAPLEELREVLPSRLRLVELL